MKPWPFSGSNSWPRMTSRPQSRMAEMTERSAASWAGQHMRFADRRKSPLATRQTGVAMIVLILSLVILSLGEAPFYTVAHGDRTARTRGDPYSGCPRQAYCGRAGGRVT